jgi:hypothetical protein
MRRRDAGIGVLGLALAIAVCRGALAMPMGTVASPGAGFLPFWAGVVLGTLSLALIVSAALAPGSERAPEEAPVARRRVKWMLAALGAYALALPHLGCPVTTLLLLGALVKVLGQRGWTAAAAFSLVATAGSYALFALWLGVPLPRGSLIP